MVMDRQPEIRKLYLEGLAWRMKETSAEVNRFAGRFLFGGLVAVIATINVDLPFTALSTHQIIGIGSTVVLLGVTYFITMRTRIERLEVGYQKCKYLYEFITNSH